MIPSGPNKELDDDIWLAVLQGKAMPDDVGASTAEIEALRAAIVDWYRQESEFDEKPDEAELERFLFRLRAERLLEKPHRTLRLPPRWLALAASICTLAIGLAMLPHFRNLPDGEMTDREIAVMRGVETRQVIQTHEPEQVLKQFQQAFEGLGIAIKLERKPGRILLDAYIPSESEVALQALFDTYKIKPDSSGQLLVEIR